MTDLDTQIQNDGSLDAAVAAMPDIEALERSEGRTFDRDDAGRFAKKEAAADAEVVKDEPKEPTAKETKPEKPVAEAAAPEEDDTEIELPPAKEGEQPTRIKLNQMVERYLKADELERQLNEAKAAPQWLPQELETHIQQVVQVQQQHAAAIRKWAELNQPQAPNDALLNPNHPAYNPHEYWAQKQQFDALYEAQLQAQARIAQMNADTNQQQEALLKSRQTREKAALLQIWPEVAQEQVAAKVLSDLNAHYKLDKQTVDSVLDHRFYALAKDALAYRALQEKQAAAVKVVKAKPKLITGSARPSTSPAQRRSADALGRLQANPNDMDAAVDALEGLL